MATKYTLVFTDTTKPGFDVQSYTANGIKVPSNPALLDRASAANTTLKLYGKGLPEYGEGVLQNLIYMLENYANGTRPEFSIEGQQWYNNVGTGSPLIAEPELFIRNATGNGNDIVNDWDAVILATGSSIMTGELTLAGTPTDPNHAVPLSVITTHTTDFNVHITPAQNILLDGLDIVGSPPALISSDINQLIGITGNVQTLIDNKLSLAGGPMAPAANITFATGGEVLGLPTVPSAGDASASKQYVDDQNILGTGELTSIIWTPPPAGSPTFIPIVANTSAVFNIVGPSTNINLTLDGISRVGHLHDAIDITLDNSFNPLYPTDVQSAFIYVGSEIDQLKNGSGGDGSTGSTTIERKFEILISDILLGSPIVPYETLEHFADDNKLAITINGVKQYTHARAYQTIIYDTAVANIDSAQPTYLDESIDYDFNVTVDGVGPTLITLVAGTPITTHGDLQAAINAELSGGSPPVGLINATYNLLPTGGIARFSTSTSGGTTTILIADPTTANTFLFDVDLSPDTISGATFLSEISQSTGSPPGSPVATPDSIEILGDVTASFPVGQVFAIKGSNETNYNAYDGGYSVHVNGAIAGGSPLTTTIPIALIYDPTINVPLLPLYDPTGSPLLAPAPAPYGSVYITPIFGMDSIDTPVIGIEGDYAETDASGIGTNVSEISTHIVFNYDILAGSKIETLKYT